MSWLEIVLTVCSVLGILAVLCSVVVTNFAVQKMRGVLNQARTSEDQLSWNDAIQYVAQRVIDEYRNRYPAGLFDKTLRTGYYMLYVGLGIALGSLFLLKFVH